jgi:hypothetical protein
MTNTITYHELYGVCCYCTFVVIGAAGRFFGLSLLSQKRPIGVNSTFGEKAR